MEAVQAFSEKSREINTIFRSFFHVVLVVMFDSLLLDAPSLMIGEDENDINHNEINPWNRH